MDVVFDTGSPITQLDPTFVAAYFGQVKDAKSTNNGKNWRVPCAAQLPDITFTDPSNGGFQHTLPGHVLVNKPASPAETSSDGQAICYSWLVANTAHSIGAPFCATQYVVFDQSKPAISIAMQWRWLGLVLGGMLCLAFLIKNSQDIERDALSSWLLAL